MTNARRPNRSWREVADSQAGVLSRRQALVGGFSSDQWDWRLASKRWQSPVPGIAVLHTGVLQPQELCWVAVLHAGWGAWCPGTRRWSTAASSV